MTESTAAQCGRSYLVCCC